MKFHYIGKLRTIDDLKTAKLRFKKPERISFKIAVIDDAGLDELLKNALHTHKFNVDIFPDLTSIEQLTGYDIVLVDIRGVGLAFNPTYQGAYLVKEIYRSFPSKVIGSYTSKSITPDYNKYLQYAELQLKKDSSTEEWIEKLDYAIELTADPINRWKRTRDFLLKEGVSMFELALLEDDFVRRILNGKSMEGFPSSKMQEGMEQNILNALKVFSELVINLMKEE